MRKNLLIAMNEPIHEEFTRLDECLTAYIAEHSERILKKCQSLEQVRANYSSCIRTSEKGYPPSLKTKVDLGSGQYGVACWDNDGNRVETPESWRKFQIRPRIVVTHLWMMGSSYGPVLRLTDALLRADEGSAPAERSVNREEVKRHAQSIHPLPRLPPELEFLRLRIGGMSGEDDLLYLRDLSEVGSSVYAYLS